MKALTVRQPWAELIVSGRKNVENRSWRTHYRGPLVVHAGLVLDDAGPKPRAPLTFGAILGVVELVDCVTNARSKWAIPGAWHWMLRNPRILADTIQCRGWPGLWDLDVATIRRVMRLLRD